MPYPRPAPRRGSAPPTTPSIARMATDMEGVPNNAGARARASALNCLASIAVRFLRRLIVY